MRHEPVHQQEDPYSTSRNASSSSSASGSRNNNIHNNRNDQKKKRDEDDFLSSLGLQTVLKHEKIMNAGRPEYVLIQNEANRIAKEAVDALKQSRGESRSGVTVNVPTWTGRHGTDPTAFPPEGGGSKSILQKLKCRRDGQLESAPLAIGSRGREEPLFHGNPRELGKQIVDFLKGKRGCRASSAEVVEKFKNVCKGMDTVVFRKILKSIATFDREHKFWELNSEFK